MRHSVCILWLSIATVLAAMAGFGVRWNASPSVAPGLYLIQQRDPARGDLVLICLPELVARWARHRGYLRRGSCPEGSQPLGKRMAGVAGDQVDIRPNTVAINGHHLPGSGRNPTDTTNRPMPLATEGVLILEPDEVWLHSGRHPRSLDSRIYGPVHHSSIQAVLEPLWTLEDH